MLKQQLQLVCLDVHCTCDNFHCLSNAFTTIPEAFEDVQDYIVHPCSRRNSCEPGWAGCVCPADGLVRSGRLDSHVASGILHIHESRLLATLRLSRRKP